MKTRATYIARTGVLLALTLLFQMSRVIIQPLLGPGHMFITGSLVNLALIVAAGHIGLTAAMLISVVAPIVAFMQGHLPPVPVIMLVVALGNMSLVFMFYFLKKRSALIAIGVGAIVKFLVMYTSLNILISLLGTDPRLSKIFGALMFGFSWPQLVTALIGGYLALYILKFIDKQDI